MNRIVAPFLSPAARWLILITIGWSCLVPRLACAAGTYGDFLEALAMRESGGNYTILNSYGYAGLYQMGEAALVDAGYYVPDGTARNDWSGTWTGKNGINSLKDFLDNPSKQNQAITDYHQRLASYIRNMGLDAYAGQTVGGVLITESGMIAGAHLVGIGGLKTFLRTNGKSIPTDALGTPITEYIATFGGYGISAVAPPYVGPPTTSGPGTAVPSTSIPGPSATPAVPPGTAFSGAARHSPLEVRLAIATLLTTFLFLWVAWTSLSHFNAWRRGALELGTFQGDMVRAMVVLCVVITVVS